MSLSFLAVDRTHVTTVVTAATGTGVTHSNPFTKHPAGDNADVLVAVASGVFTVCTANLEQSEDNGASWQVAQAGIDFFAAAVLQVQLAENVLYRFNIQTFTGTSVTIKASTTGEEALLATSHSANMVLASPVNGSGFLGVRPLDTKDLSSIVVVKSPSGDQNISGAHALNLTNASSTMKVSGAIGIGLGSVPGNTSAGSQLTSLDVESTLNDSNSTRLANFNLNYKPLSDGGSGSAVAYSNSIDPTTPGPNTNTVAYCAQYQILNEAGTFLEIYGQLVEVVDLGGCTNLNGIDIQLIPAGAVTGTTQALHLELPIGALAVQTDFALLRVGDVNPDPTNLPNGNYAVKTGVGRIKFGGISVFANNAAALAGGLSAGDLYRNGADPDHLCIVH